MHPSTATLRCDSPWVTVHLVEDMKKHGMHKTVTKHAYPSRHQRQFAYTNILWLGSIFKVFVIILRVF